MEVENVMGSIGFYGNEDRSVKFSYNQYFLLNDQSVMWSMGDV